MDVGRELLVALICGYLCASSGPHLKAKWIFGFAVMAALPVYFLYFHMGGFYLHFHPERFYSFRILIPMFYLIGVAIAFAYYRIVHKVWLRDI